MNCLFDPGGCFNDGIASIIAWYPFGIEGIKATAWMIVGAVLGRFGVAAVIGLALALKVSGKMSDVHEQLAGGKDAAPPVQKPKHRPTIFRP